MQKSWGFYGRNADLSEIDRILDSGRWFFCAISGRRRIGKTTLIHQALRKRPDLDRFYVQIPDSDERGVVQAFQDAFEDQASARELVEIFQDVLTFTGDSLAAFQDHVNRFLRTKEGRRLTGWTAEQALYCPAFADDDRRRLCRDGRVLRDLNDFKQMLYPN